MQPRRNSPLIYGLLLVVWVLVVAWQVEEHGRVREDAKSQLRIRSKEIADTLSAVIRALRFRDTIMEDSLQPVLNLLVNGRTNELVKSGDLVNSPKLLSLTLLNSKGDPIVSVGDTNFMQQVIKQGGEYWGNNTVTFVNPVYGVNVNDTNNNTTVVLPSYRTMTNEIPPGERGFPRPEQPPVGPPSTNGINAGVTNGINAGVTNAPSGFFAGAGPGGPPPPRGAGRGGPRRPPWWRWMTEDEFNALTARREVHGLVLSMSTDNFNATCVSDLWLRFMIVFFAGISAIGAGLAWRNVSKTAELQIRLVRASELNLHLKEMNLAAAGLAHETRNPLNIIRGMAQMLAKQPGAPPELCEKSRVIVDETDKVTAQLTEFINYSRPREVRRSKIALQSAVSEVVRTLAHDIEEKKVAVDVIGEPLSIEADEQLLRQLLFNLIINAVQAVDTGGRIQICARHDNAAEATLEVRDDGPGVAPDRREEVFKPYFTTNQKGTGLGLAVVQQIVLAHGWEIACLGNEPKGAIFRVSHLRLA